MAKRCTCDWPPQIHWPGTPSISCFLGGLQASSGRLLAAAAEWARLLEAEQWADAQPVQGMALIINKLRG